MKRIIKAALSVLAACVTAFCASAAAFADCSGEVGEMMRGIEKYNMNECGAASVQEWIDGGISENIGLGGEWYILALNDGGYDLSSVKNALCDRIENGGKLSAVSGIRYALFLIAVGDKSHDTFIKKCADEYIGAQGIMSLIFGLHLLNNGVESASYTADEAVSELLSARITDGGWAVMGERSDADVTAMAIQALAPYYDKNDDAKDAVDGALLLLSGMQLDDGDYANLGKPNPESTAQVFAALLSVGTDPESDERFVKNGRTLLDGIKKYRLPDGSCCHEAGGSSNATATVQVYYCLSSYQKMLQGERLYVFGQKPSEAYDAPAEELSVPAVTAAEVHGDEPPAAAENIVAAEKGSYKPAAYIIVAGAFALVCAALFITGKRSVKNFAFAFFAAAAAAVFIALTNFSSAEDYYATAGGKDNIVGSVTLSVSCASIVGEDGENIPADGFILPEESFDILDGETVCDILTEAAKKHELQLDLGADGYVRGIGFLYEFDYGDLSGWMYRVNGVMPSVNCAAFRLSDGDRIEWIYTKNIGKDLE